MLEVTGYLGTMATLVGVWLSFVQIRRTKSATEATRAAVDSTLRQVSSDFGRYATATAKRHLSDAKQSVDNGDWRRAALRCSDLAEQVTFLSKGVDPWLEFAKNLRQWEMSFGKVRAGEHLMLGQAKRWERLAMDIERLLDRTQRPFETGAGND